MSFVTTPEGVLTRQALHAGRSARLRSAQRYVLIAALALFGFAAHARAQQNGDQQQPPPAATPTTANQPTPDATSGDGSGLGAGNGAAGTTGDRIFGVLPNYTTVEGAKRIDPVTNKQAFKMAALDSFDPFVYPLFGFIAAVNHVENQEPSWGRGFSGYSRRYGAAFADNTVCSLITTGVMPTLFKQDPRYFQLGKGQVVRRIGYAASRSLVTHSRTGQPRFNLSEIGGTAVVAGISNLYYPASDRTVTDTIVRWGMQAMWDTVANELKEFWPDIRRKIHRS